MDYDNIKLWADEAYFGEGSAAMYERYQACSKERLEELKQYLNDVLQPAAQNMAEQAVRFHVQGTAAELEQLAASRREEHEAAAASLEGGVALEEKDVMEGLAYKHFEPPVTVLPGDLPDGVGVAAAVQAAAVERLRERVKAIPKEESWGRVAVWKNGGEFVASPDDASLEPLPRDDGELAALGKTLAGFKTDAIQQSLENLQEQVTAKVDALLAKMEDAQESFSSLLEVMGVDLMDIL